MLKTLNHTLKKSLIWTLIISMSAVSAFAQDEPEKVKNTYENNPLLSEPETPAERFDAVILLNKLGRSDLAKKHLQMLVAGDLSDEIVLELRDNYGPAIFLNLSRIKALQPESQQLLDKMNEAFRKQALDPARIKSLIADLTAGGGKTQIALTAITDLGAPIVPALLKEFVSTTDETTRNAILYSIVQIGEQAVPVLIGGVMSPSESIQDSSIIALGWMNDRTAIRYLWFPAFGPDIPTGRQVSARLALKRIMQIEGEAVVSPANLANELTRLTQTHLQNNYPWKLDADNMVSLWLWDSEIETLSKQQHEPEVASLIVGSHFSRQALALSPNNQSTQATYLALALAKEYHSVGWDQPLPTGPGTVYNLALTSGSDVITESLSISMQNSNLYAVLASLQALSQIATSQQLVLNDSREASLLSALNYPSNRVQFAAATTILKIDPEKSFVGNDRIISILSSALNDSRNNRAIVIDPDHERGATFGERLGDRGFDSEVVKTGREGFQIATQRMDVKLIAVHINSIRWSLSQTLTNFKADARTASLPIIIYGPQSQEYKLLETIERNSLTMFLPETIDSVLFAQYIQEFLSTIDTPDLTPEQKISQVETAAYWLSYIAASRRNDVYDLKPAETALTSGLVDPEIAHACLLGLSSIATQTSQQTLLSSALLEHNSPETRRTAAYQLAYHIQRYGWLLDNGSVNELHQTHESTTDSELATALAAVIGSLKPNSQLVGERLRNFESAQ